MEQIVRHPANDAIVSRVLTWANQVGTITETHPDKAMRDAAGDAEMKLEAWFITLDYRDDIYRVLQAFAATKPALDALSAAAKKKKA